ncbi:P-loop containing nucleoside triphosphate hydrolase protein [Lindgomyces ingoldianus]|uniref:P-loop containing nucleoside triphosphate hydrolase protein n=1 Tax=Lindgomyces ingoldianus TaxID=673940 RepID=A0ACB6QPM1_9PLEO|nr:P-loop containing nucleoside triphosphate hydrolase protein [Lindgomyces ingoldianus]KAF2468237.1 P-loop containing nucleoside triphosphate hydrolase protein [Lindgomyces ingoldianus]
MATANMSDPFQLFDWDELDQPENQSAPEPGLKLELRTYDVRETSKGDKVPLETGKTTKFRAQVDKDRNSAMVVTKSYYSNQTLKQVELVIRSPHIKAAMASVIKKYPEMNLGDEKITIIGPPRCLFHFRKELRAYGRQLRDRDAAEHLAFALNYMQTNLAEDISHYNNCIAKHGDSPGLDFERLWMEYRPGDLIFVKSNGVEWIGRLVRMTAAGFIWKHWDVELETIIYQGSVLRYWTEDVQIPTYDGFKQFKDLDVFPLRYHPERQAITRKMMDRGEKFLGLKGVHQRFYCGPAQWASDRKNDEDDDWDFHFEKFKVTSRVMIDAAGFCEARPDHADAYFSSYEKSKIAQIAPDSLSGEQKLIYSHQVHGFSLTDKRWCVFEVDNIKPIDYDGKAFDNLRLPQEQKDTLLALAKIHTKDDFQFDDFIKGKGRGMIVLLHGEPGIGKTLTAESIADYTKKPLFPIRSGDLGVEASSLEKCLNEAFEMAAKWNAIILIDEADVYLEQRQPNELQRNSLVSVFLRVLEYYEGIMFLTTNRVEQFDLAVKSRIHLTLKYSRLSEASRRALWHDFLQTGSSGSNLNHFDDRLLDELASHDLNGRQMRNVVRTAYAIALSKGSSLTADHLRTTIKAMVTFQEERNLSDSDSSSVRHEWGSHERRRKRPRLLSHDS